MIRPYSRRPSVSTICLVVDPSEMAEVEGLSDPRSLRRLSLFLVPEQVDGCKLFFEKHGLVDRFVQLLQAFEYLRFLSRRLVAQQEKIGAFFACCRDDERNPLAPSHATTSMPARSLSVRLS